jgi:hypothetical protein
MTVSCVMPLPSARLVRAGPFRLITSPVGWRQGQGLGLGEAASGES